MTSPDISVIIPAYNAGKFIGDAIGSVQSQTYQNFEVIVVDDCSSDDTAAVVEALSARDPRVRLIKSPENKGPGHARNLGLELAEGEWVTLLDADDWYQSERLERLLKAAVDTNVDVLADNQRFVVDEQGNGTTLLIDYADAEHFSISIEDFIRGDRVRRNSRNLGLLKPFVRRGLLRQRGIRYDDARRLPIGEDFCFLLQCLRVQKKMTLVSMPLYNYRVYDEGMLTKRQTIESLLDWRAMHERMQASFDPLEDPEAMKLLVQRGKDIDRYIAVRKLIEPLRNRRFGAFALAALSRPTSLLLLAADAIRDPAAIRTLILRRVNRQQKQPSA